MTDFARELAGRVAQARTVSGLTQTELGERVGLSRASIANIEAGRQGVSAEQIIQFATAAGVDPRWLLTGWEPGRPPVLPGGHAVQEIRKATAQLLKIGADVAKLERHFRALEPSHPTNTEDQENRHA